jgi:predicted permease
VRRRRGRKAITPVILLASLALIGLAAYGVTTTVLTALSAVPSATFNVIRSFHTVQPDIWI